jgi:hypothetical protein
VALRLIPRTGGLPAVRRRAELDRQASLLEVKLHGSSGFHAGGVNRGNFFGPDFSAGNVAKS